MINSVSDFKFSTQLISTLVVAAIIIFQVGFVQFAGKMGRIFFTAFIYSSKEFLCTIQLHLFISTKVLKDARLAVL